ncbi:MAG TPA: hypothetical protein PLX35_06750 [Cyclobacteriaceae bacterium]|nr:hypothetical protein [Cyclobacteriaceae bacterium]
MNSGKFLTSLTIIYFAQMMVPVLFSGVVVFLNMNGAQPSGDNDPTPFKYIMYGLVPGATVIAHIVFKQQLSGVNPEWNLRQKLVRFQTAMLIRSALIEVPGLLGAVFALLTGDLTFLIFTGMMVVLFVYWRPTVDTISVDLQLSEQDRALLSDHDGTLPE